MSSGLDSRGIIARLALSSLTIFRMATHPWDAECRKGGSELLRGVRNLLQTARQKQPPNRPESLKTYSPELQFT